MAPMTLQQQLIMYGCLLVTMLLCRCGPMFLLKGRELPEGVTRALNLIPPAAFAALVANDLLSPGMFDQGLWPAAAPLVSAVVCVAVARLTRSLAWCAVAGVAVYALLTLVPLPVI